MDNIELSVEEGIAYAQKSAYFDGLADGARLVADHAKDMLLRDIQMRKAGQQASQSAPKMDACDCREYPNQVCDICQGRAGKDTAVNGHAS